MKRTLIIFYLIGCLAWLSSCQKDTDQFILNSTTGGLDTNWVSAVTDANLVSALRVSLAKEKSLDSIDISVGGTIVTHEGLTLTLLPSSLLLPNNTLASGKIYVETFLIKQKGDMVKMDRPTTSNGRILISGGEIFVRLRKETDELHLASGKNIYLKYFDTAPSSQMKIFYGDESNTERFNWLQNTDTSQLNSLRINLDSYEMSATRLRWVNCDYFATDTTGTRTKIIASLPVDYTNANTAVYLVFKDQKTVMSMYGDFSTKKFSVANIPAGKQVIVVSITKKGDNSFFLGHETITTGATGTTAGQIVPLTPQPTSLTDIKTYLATL